jgi:hypothetical protein
MENKRGKSFEIKFEFQEKLQSKNGIKMLHCGLNKHEIDGKNNVIDESAKKHHQKWKIKNY